ncbi:hypothetical protein GCM10009771_06320 [Nesterenkonia flava]
MGAGVVEEFGGFGFGVAGEEEECCCEVGGGEVGVEGFDEGDGAFFGPVGADAGGECCEVFGAFVAESVVGVDGGSAVGDGGLGLGHGLLPVV